MAQIKKEPAPSANGTSTKENLTNIIVPEIPADVNPCDEISDEDFCCEVTGDTDMEAYLADREKFFAAKRRVLPVIVWEALMEKMEDLNGKITAARSDIKEWTDEISKISAFIAGYVMPTSDEEVQQ